MINLLQKGVSVMLISYYAARANLYVLHQQHPEWSHAELASALGSSKSWVEKWLKRFRVLVVFLSLFSLTALWLTCGLSAERRFTFGPYIMGDDTTWALLAGTFSLLVLLTCSLLLTMTTSPVALIEGLTMLMAPLRRIKFPVDDFALMTLLALRFIPTMIDEVEHLIKAQTARGADMTQGSIRERLQSLSMLFVPLMQGTLRQASDLAVALEARGYEVNGQQTMLHETALQVRDYAVLIALVMLIVGTLWL